MSEEAIKRISEGTAPLLFDRDVDLKPTVDDARAQHGHTIDDIIGMAHVFPTMSEGVKKANQAFYRDVTTMSCCVE